MSVSNEPSLTARVAVEEIPDKRRLPAAPRSQVHTLPTSATPAALAAREAELDARQHTLSATSAVMTTIAKVLAVRLQLLLSLIGAFALAIGAMAWQSQMGLFVMIAFCALTVIPLVVLEWAGRPR